MVLLFNLEVVELILIIIFEKKKALEIQFKKKNSFEKILSEKKEVKIDVK